MVLSVNLVQDLSVFQAKRIDLKEVKVVDYKKKYNSDFSKISKAWLEQHFDLEDTDEQMLADPEKYIIDPGGHILFLKYQRNIIGTVALKYIDDKTFELSKMGVLEGFKGIGAGRLLCNAAIEWAKTEDAEQLILYSVKSLKPAVSLYKKMGFVEVELDKVKYARVDIKMSLDLV